MKREAREKNDAFIKNAHYLLKRTEKGIGVIEEEFGLTRGYVSRCISQKRSISLALAFAISDELGVSIDELADENMLAIRELKDIDRQIEILMDRKTKIMGGENE